MKSYLLEKGASFVSTPAPSPLNLIIIAFSFSFFSFGRRCLILKALILNGMEIDSINCMFGGMKDKQKLNVIEEASDVAEKGT